MENEKNNLVIKIFFLGILFFVLSNFANATEDLSHIINSGGTIYFAHDFESGDITADQGDGFISYLGGNINKPVGDYSSSCTIDSSNFHYSYFSNNISAQESVPDSLQSLVTPYLGNCPNESFLRDTTIVTTPLLSEYYVRWYQKWTGSFEANVQQKFTKFYNSADYQQNTITGHMSLASSAVGATTGRARSYLPNIDGHFDKDGCVLADNIWVNALKSTQGTCYAGQNQGWDDSESTSSEIIFELDRWYVIEIHSKLNSDISLSDGIYEIWVDGVKRLEVTNFKFKDGVIYNTPGTNQFEFQHIYYNRSATDQPTYMDNIVISDSYIGPIETSDTTPPSAPSGLSVS